MKCLKINDKWLVKILDGDKTLEIRRTRTSHRGPIALGNTKTKKVEGYAYLDSCVELPVKELKKYDALHRASQFLDEYANGKKTLFAYRLDNVVRESKPFPYSFSTGSWCTAPVDSTHYQAMLVPLPIFCENKTEAPK